MESSPPKETAEATTLTVMTCNVWFSRLHFEDRARAILRIAREHDADLIALQEVTAEFVDQLLGDEWFRDRHWISDGTGDTVYPYGVLLLTRIPPRRLRLLDLPSMMGRSLLTAELEINGHRLDVATVHLESLNSAEFRATQLELIQPGLRRAEHALVMGDFNFCSSWAEEEQNIEPDFHDLWPLLRGNDPGYTKDPLVNHMLQGLDKRLKQVRFDRILFRGRAPGWRPRSIELVGNQPLSDSRPDVFPSDHFGLVARLEWEV
jgi:endonuclease/exonuclease/phosphatase family metal-dependent hydrolase